MTPETLFQVANTMALLCWISLVFFPRSPLLSRLLIPVVACGLLGILYLFLLVTNAADAEGGFGSLQGVAKLFENKQVLLAGWIHYLAFDLFIGSWEVRDAQRNGIAHIWIVPALLLTFIVGPAGLLAYYLIRLLRTRDLEIDERSSATEDR